MNHDYPTIPTLSRSSKTKKQAKSQEVCTKSRNHTRGRNWNMNKKRKGLEHLQYEYEKHQYKNEPTTTTNITDTNKRSTIRRIGKDDENSHPASRIPIPKTINFFVRTQLPMSKSATWLLFLEATCYCFWKAEKGNSLPVVDFSTMLKKRNKTKKRATVLLIILKSYY